MTCNAHARPQRSCNQGRQPCPTPWNCNLKTACGGETVDTEGTPAEKQRLPLGYWLTLALSSAVSLAWLVAEYGR